MTKQKMEAVLLKYNNGAVLINQTAIGKAFGWGPHRVQDFCRTLEPICPGRRTRSYLVADVAAKASELTNAGGGIYDY